MNHLVSGGCGFIGSHIFDALIIEGSGVMVFDDLSSGKRENLAAAVILHTGDVSDQQAVAAALSGGVDCVFHLAARIDVRKAVENPGLDAQVNVGGTVNVLSACVEAHIRWFVMSSTGGALYGEPLTLPASEQSAIQPLSPYGVSKYCAEQYIGYFHRACGLETVILWYANQARDFVFVDDVAQANMLAMRGSEGTYNIGIGVETSLNGLLAAFEHVVGHPVVWEYAPARAGEVQRIALNAERAQHELGWGPAMSLEDRLAQTLAWVDTCL